MQLKGFYWDDSFGLYRHGASGQIDYHDGSEDYLAGIFGSLEPDNELCPAELERYIKDWPTRYHLSSLRSNLLAAVEEFLPTAGNVLELGAGAGALTTWLCKRFRSVDAVEGTMDRAKVLKLRAGHFKNLRVFVGDITKMEFPDTYDLITLIGVLEYIPYFTTDCPDHAGRACIDFLSRLARYLNPDGVLMIATENKLGAKYFSGFPEDHNGIHFSGIMDYPVRSPITFSRNELEDILSASGLKHTKFYHTFPDYKLPTTVIKEDPRMYDVDIPGFVRGLFPDYSNQRNYLFHDSLFIGTLAKARLLHHFSNSFLVLSSTSASARLDARWLVRKFWNEGGKRPLLHHTISLESTDGSFFIKRKSLPGGKEAGEYGKIRFNLSETSEYVAGANLMTPACKSVFLNDRYALLTNLLKEIVKHLDDRFFSGSLDDEGYHLIDGRSIDCCFWNLLRTKDGQLVQIDNKWSHADMIPTDYVIFRNLLGLFTEARPFMGEADSLQFILPIMQGIFPLYTEERFHASMEREIDLQNSIRIHPIDHSGLSPAKDTKSCPVMLTRLREKNEELLRELQGVRGQLHDTEASYAEMQRAHTESYSDIMNSASWRLTRPLRAAARLIGRFLFLAGIGKIFQ
jgi:trans-aconitate methyltransferase